MGGLSSLISSQSGRPAPATPTSRVRKMCSNQNTVSVAQLTKARKIPKSSAASTLVIETGLSVIEGKESN